MPAFYDTHAHLDQPAFADDLDRVLQTAYQKGVARIIAVGITASSSEATTCIAKKYDMVRAAVGIQPNEVVDAEPGDWDRVAALVEEPEVVAIGETGLDLYWDKTPFPRQQDYFDRHLQLSQTSGLPFIVHMRDCQPEVLAMLREARSRGPLRGVMHSFTGDTAMAAECLELGLHISFAGMVTFKKSHELRETARSVPLDRLLVETDCPYLSPEPVRKIRRNEPSHVVHTAKLLAEVRGEPLDAFAERTTANAEQLFCR